MEKIYRGGTLIIILILILRPYPLRAGANTICEQCGKAYAVRDVSRSIVRAEDTAYMHRVTRETFFSPNVERRNAMSNPNGQASPVATNAGTIVQVPDLVVPANRIAGFVAQYKKTYFEDHGLEWCLDEIISRGMAEIKRQVKTAIKTRENKVSGDLLRAYNLTPTQAMELLKQAKLAAEAAKAGERS